MTRHGHPFGDASDTLASSSLEPRAAVGPIAVTLSNNIQSCSPMTVTWDASKGHTPWTITVAPVNQLPVSVTIPTAPSSSTQLSWQWDVPNYPTSLDVIVAVSDASGVYSGVSTFSKIATSSSSCAAPASGLDFVWYPQSEKVTPTECGTWTLQWQVDKTNNGITPPVQFVVLGEESQPMQYAAGIRDTEWDMPVALKSGTKFVVAAFDDGKSGTGGVGEAYTVGPRVGTKCVANAGLMASPGLVAAKTQATVVASSAAASSSSSSSSSAHHKSAQSTNAAATPQTTNSTSNADASSSSSSSSSHGGAIAGAVVGCLLAAAALVGFYIFWKRRKANGNGGRSGWPAADVMPWRWEVVDENEKRGRGGSRGGGGGGGSGSGAGTFTVHHVRRPSQTPGAGVGAMPGGDSYASGTDSFNGYHASKPSLSSRNIYSVVPDEALFPPPSSQAHGNGDTSPQRRQREREMSSGSLERPPRPAVAKVVPDSMLFPPPAPSPAVGTPVGGVGAGVGTYAALNRGAERSWDSAGTGNGGGSNGGMAPRSLTTQQQQQQYAQQRMEDSTPRSPPPARKASPPRYPAAMPPASSSFPVSTSIHDPYAHMSRIYNDPAMQARLASLTNNNHDAPPLPQAQVTRDRSASNSSAPRLPPLLYPGARGKVDAGAGAGGGGLDVPQRQLGRKGSAASSKRSSLGSDVDASLPYL